MARKASLLPLILLLLAGRLFAQDAPKPNPAPRKVCDICFSKASNHDVIAVDQNGVYMQDAREIYLFVRAGVGDPIVNLSFWRGSYKPSTPKKEVWTVRNIRIIEVAEFQKIVDAAEAAGGP